MCTRVEGQEIGRLDIYEVGKLGGLKQAVSVQRFLIFFSSRGYYPPLPPLANQVCSMERSWTGPLVVGVLFIMVGVLLVFFAKKMLEFETKNKQKVRGG